jgi:hypothetical protein
MSDVAFNAPVPWPSSDDDLFGTDDGRWRGLAHLGGLYGVGADSAVYATGYREAAEVLVQHVLAQGYHEDFLVFPIMFLYRQYVELRLKEIAALGARLIDAQPPPANMMAKHELAPLWSFCRRIVEQADSGPASDLDNAERTIDKIMWADRGSYAFRYATDKQGNRSLPAGLEEVDLGRVHEVMSGVGNLLDGIVDFIQAEQDLKDEWQREVAGW